MVHQRPHVYPIYASCASMYSHIRGRQKTVKLVRFPRRARAAASVTKPGLGAAGRGAAGDAESGRGAPAPGRHAHTHSATAGPTPRQPCSQVGGRATRARVYLATTKRVGQPGALAYTTGRRRGRRRASAAAPAAARRGETGESGVQRTGAAPRAPLHYDKRKNSHRVTDCPEPPAPSRICIT